MCRQHNIAILLASTFELNETAFAPPEEITELIDATNDLMSEGLQATIYAFEQIYLGKKTFDDIDWVKKVLESKLSGEFIDKVKSILEQVDEEKDSSTILKLISSVFWVKK